ncbi:hypothetical protein MsAg5_06030 [Methanosarcinaceae archaeon Ag5]|uniref:HEPN domain-containing protein n=1 Tax=Methanolapillus africanus TaxID=3028297 RepID=A0AAE4MJ24_9EURY|nr:hypothetical protein [Methanosarcinaceae archaeon Ag5]
MDFKPAHFLYLSIYLTKLAKSNLPISESFYRTAVGRAYYASFWEARAYAENNLNFVSSGTGGDHRFLASCYRDSDNKSIRSVGLLLSKLRTWRNISDYESSDKYDVSIERKAVEAISYAVSIFSELNRK